MWHLHHLWSVQYCEKLHPVESGRFRSCQWEGEDDGRDLCQWTDQVCNLCMLVLYSAVDSSLLAFLFRKAEPPSHKNTHSLKDYNTYSNQKPENCAYYGESECLL